MIDAHFHSWLLSRGDYGWLTPALPAIYRDVSIADWQAQASAHNVKAGVLVQAAPTEAETQWLLAQAQQHPAVLGVVGWVDLLAPDAPARIRALATNPKLKGLRPMLQDITDPDWILQAALAPALQTMSDLGLVLDALIKPLHLPRLLTLAARYPALKLVIDHAAKPDIAAGQWEPWASDLARVGEQTGAVCKISGLLTEAGPQPNPATPSPSRTLACSTACIPTASGSANAATPSGSPSGTGCSRPASASRTTSSGVRPPNGPPPPMRPSSSLPGSTTTRSPTCTVVTWSPTHDTTPAISWPRQSGSGPGPAMPPMRM
jgi:L-fuconolactonase